ncbi:MAG: YihY/virulence factor BrkB family protein [Clostridiales Family XIII bacterium]|jgi:membrane protein|nr:YihY/virulence factor BrkB family protein [Clostridiales Family XIII bacterium]
MDPFYAGGAAEVAFFLLLSLAPATILFARIAGLFTMSIGAIQGVLAEYLEPEILEVIEPLLSYNPSNTVSVLLILLALWSGSKALVSLMRISKYAYNREGGRKHPILDWLRRRARAIASTVVILVILFFSLYILVFGDVIVRIVLHYVNDFLGEDYIFSEAWYTVRWALAFLLYLLMVIVVYFMLPGSEEGRLSGGNRGQGVSLSRWARAVRARLRMVLPGALFASMGLLVATLLYSIYIGYISAGRNFNILYGGMTSIVLLLIWFYVIAFILIVGIQYNAAWAESKALTGQDEKRGTRAARKRRAKKSGMTDDRE